MFIRKAHIVDDENKLKVSEFTACDDVTFLFLDIRGFTIRTLKATEQHDMGSIREILNTYIPMATRIILSHNGVIDKYNGDGIMAIFGYTQKGSQKATPVDAINAAARIMQQGLAAMNQSLAAKEIAPIEIGIGMEFGKECQIAMLGDPDNPAGHAELTMIADGLNRAAKLEKIAMPGEIIIGEDLRVELITRKFQENCFRKIDKCDLKQEQVYLEPSKYIYDEADRASRIFG